jgi:hypothetical protein
MLTFWKVTLEMMGVRYKQFVLLYTHVQGPVIEYKTKLKVVHPTCVGKAYLISLVPKYELGPATSRIA